MEEGIYKISSKAFSRSNHMHGTRGSHDKSEIDKRLLRKDTPKTKIKEEDTGYIFSLNSF
jgi:hypothetical protein